MADGAGNLGLPVKPVRPLSPLTMPPRITDTARAAMTPFPYLQRLPSRVPTRSSAER